MPAVPWQTRPLFVTSTFRDMHAERDHLRAVVFPALEELLRARWHHLEPIDLRLGVETADAADEAARELLVLKVCLGEIERSRPFLIGLLGDRYGHVPAPERLAAAAQEAGWSHDLTGRSVTALEVEFGVLGKPAQQARSRFYLRAPLPYDRMDPSTAADYSEAYAHDRDAPARRQRLADLKALLRQTLPAERVRPYQAEWDATAQRVVGLEAWGRQVLYDLWVDLDAATRDFEVAPPATWQEEEARLLEQFVATTCHEFVGRDALLAQLMRLATDRAPGAAVRGSCVVGPPGAGKSALFAELHRRLRDHDVLLLAHAAGISPRAADVDAVLRRWGGELAAALGIADPTPELRERDALRDAFATLLARAATSRRVVCLLDALNQLERTPAGEHTTWLPDGWPDNARLIVTTTPGTEADGLVGRRPWVERLDLPPLTATEAEAIAYKVAHRRRAAVRPELLAVLSGKETAAGAPAAGNPLWLELALEAVLLLDADDFARLERQYTGTPEARLHALRLDVAGTLPGDVAELYAHLLQQAEKVHGAALARAFVCLLALGRTGWRETDLRALLPVQTGAPWDALRVAALRRGFRAHLVQRGAHGEWDVAHAQLRAAVQRRYLADAAVAQALHTGIADHLDTLSSEDPLRQTELMHHLLRSGDVARAARHYGSDLPAAEQVGATRALAAEVLARAAAGPACADALLTVDGVSDAERGVLANRFIFDLADALENPAPLAVRLAVHESARRALTGLAAADPGNAGWQRDLSVSHLTVGDVLEAQGNLPGALAAYRESLGIRERLAAADPGNAGWQRDLGAAHCYVGMVLQEQGNLPAALEAYRAYQSILERLAAADPGNAGWQRDLWVSCWKMADLAERTGTGDARAWWRRAHDVLAGMKARGLFVSAEDEGFLAALDRKLAN